MRRFARRCGTARPARRRALPARHGRTIPTRQRRMTQAHPACAIPAPRGRAIPVLCGPVRRGPVRRGPVRRGRAIRAPASRGRRATPGGRGRTDRRGHPVANCASANANRAHRPRPGPSLRLAKSKRGPRRASSSATEAVVVADRQCGGPCWRVGTRRRLIGTHRPKDSFFRICRAAQKIIALANWRICHWSKEASSQDA